MSDLNQCTFTGRLGADPEVRSFQNGGKVCNFRLAVGQSWKDKASGERKERTEWVTVAITNEGLAGIAERFLRKGSRVAISGEWRTRKWQAQDGGDRYSTECVLPPFGGSLTLLDPPAGDGRGERKRGYDERDSNETQSGGGWASNSGADLDDDIPF